MKLAVDAADKVCPMDAVEDHRRMEAEEWVSDMCLGLLRVDVFGLGLSPILLWMLSVFGLGLRPLFCLAVGLCKDGGLCLFYLMKTSDGIFFLKLSEYPQWESLRGSSKKKN